MHLKNSCDAVIDVGTIPVGKFINRKITIVNNGQSRVLLKFVLIDIVIEESPNSSKSTCTKISQFSLSSSPNTAGSEDVTSFIQISPSATKNLKSNRELDVSIKFKALRRVKVLKATLGVQVDASIFPLVVLKGRCSSASFYFNRTYISFGTVFEECPAEEKFVLVNDGDVGSK